MDHTPPEPAGPVTHDDARRRFPAGLFQPEGSFRFSRDALLLADFAAALPWPGQSAAVADLGAGCGVVGLGFMLARPDLSPRVVGVEKDPSLACAARDNADRLGLLRYRVVTGDVVDSATLREARDQLGASAPLFDGVLCNPPWRVEGAGRLPPEAARRAALFGDSQTLGRFFRAADRLLRQGGSLAAICGAERVADALAALPERLRLRRLRFVHARHDRNAVFVLLEAVKGGKGRLRVEAPHMLN